MMKYEGENRAMTVFAVECVMSFTLENSVGLGELNLEPMKIISS